MDDERCSITDLLKDQCAHCQGHLLEEEKESQADYEFLRHIGGW